MQFLKNLGQKTGKVGKRLFGYEQLHQGFKDQSQVIKDMVTYNTTEVKSEEENFYIPAKQVKGAEQGFKILVAIFIGLVVLALVYFIANLIVGNWITAILSLAFGALCVSLAFRYHFWLYQIKKGALGLTFDDYYKDEIESHLQPKKKPVVKKDKK